MRHALDRDTLYGAVLVIKNNLCLSSNIITNHASNQVIGVELKQGLRVYSVYCRASLTGISEVLDPISNDSCEKILEASYLCRQNQNSSPHFSGSQRNWLEIPRHSIIV